MSIEPTTILVTLIVGLGKIVRSTPSG